MPSSFRSVVAGLCRASFVLCLVLLHGCGGGDAQSRYNRGVDAFQKKDYPRAVIEFQNALQRDPSLVEARYLLALSLLEQDSHEAAEQHLRRVVEQQPDHLKARVELIPFLVGEGRIEQAMRTVEEARRLEPGNARPPFLLSRSQLHRGGLAEALPAIEQALQLDPDNLEYLTTYAQICLEIGKRSRSGRLPGSAVDWTAKAEETLNKILAEDPESLQALLLRAQLCTSRGDLSTADRLLTRAAQLAPQDEMISAMQANLLTRSGHFDEAAKRIRDLLGTGRGSPALEVELARALMGQAARALVEDQVGTAQELLKQARVLLEAKEVEKPSLAYALAQTGNLKQAEGIYDTQLDAGITEAQRKGILFSYALLALLSENESKADSLSAQLRESAPQSLEHWRLAALMKQPAENRTQEAQRIFTEEGPILHNILDMARSLGLTGLQADSERLLELAATLAPRSPVPKFTEGTVALARGEEGAAVAHFQAAYEIDPLFSPALLAIADRMSAAGQQEQALANYEQFLDAVPGNLRAETGKALALAALHRDAQAFELLEQLIEKNADPAYFQRLVQDVERTGWHGEAGRLINDIQKHRPDSPLGYLVIYLHHREAARQLEAEGESSESQKRHALAGQAVEAGLERNPSSLALLLCRAEWDLASGALDRAAQTGQRILRLKEDSKAAFQILLDAHTRRQDLASASEVCEQALGRWPEDPDLLLWKVKILARQGDFEGALSVFRQLQERAPLDARYLLVLAQLAVEQGHLKEAMATLDAVIALAPDNPEPYLRLADLYASQGAFPQAEEKLKQAEERFPGDVRVPLAYGDLLARRGEHARAMAKYQQALKVRPGNLQAIARLGRELLQAGRSEAVAPLVQEATLAPGRSRVALHLANEAQAQGQLATAEQLYQMALQHPTAALPAQVGLARIAAAHRDKEQALQYYEAAMESASPSTRFLLLLGAGDVASASWGEPSQQWQQNLQRAGKYYGETLRLPSQATFLALFRLAGVAWARGDDSAAEEYLEKAVAERPENEILQLLLAQAREKGGKPLEARQITEKLLTAMSDAPDPLGFLSHLGQRLKALIASDTDVRQACLGREGDYVREFLLGVAALEVTPPAGALLAAPPRREETRVEDLQEAAWRQALSHFERVRQLQPASPLGFWSTAAVLSALGQAERATALLQEWLEQHPADHLTRLELARLSARAGAFSRALEEVDRVLEQEPVHAKALLVKAGLLSSPEVNRAEEAASILAEFLRAQPGHTGAALSLIRILLGQGKAQEAVNAGESFLAANPENTAVISQLAGIYLERQDYPKALEWYEKALELTPNSPGALNNLAYAYAQTGREVEKALSLIQTALRMLPGNPALLDTLGYVYLKQGRIAEAIETFEEVLRRAPNLEATRYHLALAYQQQGSRAKAIEQLESALAGEFPMKAHAEELLNKLRTSPASGG